MRLAPLARKVQSDATGEREAPATAEEWGAYDRLRHARETRFRPVRVTGPLVGEQGAEHLRLEVRAFDWRPR